MSRGKVGFQWVHVRRQASDLAELYTEPKANSQSDQMHDGPNEKGVVQGRQEVIHQALVLEHRAPLAAGVMDREAPIGIEWDDGQVREGSENLIA